MTITLGRWRTRWILEALRSLDDKWEGSLKDTVDEDLHADVGMDIAKLHMLQEELEEAAAKAFGPDIKTFSREVFQIESTFPSVDK